VIRELLALIGIFAYFTVAAIICGFVAQWYGWLVWPVFAVLVGFAAWLLWRYTIMVWR
jgi:membrane protein implicated in regulation of membrane protease activity